MIEAVIETVRSQAQPISGENLLGFSIDAEHYLSESGVLLDVTVGTTSRPGCLIEARATVADHVQSLQDVSAALRQAWSSLAYNDLEAASLCWYREATVLRFATLMRSPRLFVTGRVVAGGGPQERLAQRFLKDFGDLGGTLPPLPRELA